MAGGAPGHRPRGWGHRWPTTAGPAGGSGKTTTLRRRQRPPRLWLRRPTGTQLRARRCGHSRRRDNLRGGGLGDELVAFGAGSAGGKETLGAALTGTGWALVTAGITVDGSTLSPGLDDGAEPHHRRRGPPAWAPTNHHRRERPGGPRWAPLRAPVAPRQTTPTKTAAGPTPRSPRRRRESCRRGWGSSGPPEAPSPPVRRGSCRGRRGPRQVRSAPLARRMPPPDGRSCPPSRERAT